MDEAARRRARRAARRRALVRRRRFAALVVLAALGGGLLLLLAGGDGDSPAEAPPVRAATLGPSELAGQRIVAGWDGQRPPRGLRKMVRRGELAGLILFADNLADPEGAGQVLDRLQALPRPAGHEDALLVMVDQEGGRVRRLEGPPESSAARMAARDSAYARREGVLTARFLLELGINVDLAPVLDVARPDSALEREDRTFGRSPEAVVANGVDGFATGLREGGVAATAKHFPGLGAAATNTDLAAETIDVSIEELRGRDEPPFRSFVESGGELVMLSLATYPALAERPAAFSRAVVTGELREWLGFDGVSVTDALDAEAATSWGPEPRIARAAAEAGNDLLLYPDWRSARDAQRLLARLIERGELDEGEARAAAERVLALRARY